MRIIQSINKNLWDKKTRYWNNIKFKEDNDTYDTFLKSKGEQGVNYGLYIISKKVSFPSSKDKEDNDTYDTLSEKENNSLNSWSETDKQRLVFASKKNNLGLSDESFEKLKEIKI